MTEKEKAYRVATEVGVYLKSLRMIQIKSIKAFNKCMHLSFPPRCGVQPGDAGVMSKSIGEQIVNELLSITSIITSIISVGLAIWFASSAKKDASQAQRVLNTINNSVETWQKQIMNSTVSILDSLPQVVEGKIALSRAEIAERMAQNINQTLKELSEGKKEGLSVHESTEMFKALTSELSVLLDSIKLK